MPCLCRISPSTFGSRSKTSAAAFGEREARHDVGHDAHARRRRPPRRARRRPAGRSGSAPRSNGCGRRICAAGRRAAASRPTGWAPAGSSRLARCTRTMSSSVSASRARSLRSGSSRTAGRPGGSIVAMSQPEPLTQSTSVVVAVQVGDARLHRGVAAAMQHELRIARRAGAWCRRAARDRAARRRSGRPRLRASRSTHALFMA